ncbi:deoxyribodipyrimidine photolyase [soil metagenome]
MATINDARVRKANERPANGAGDYVLYWCQMSRRLSHNHAFDYALHLANHHKKPLVVYEGLKLNYPWACARFHTFMLEGMRDNAAAAAKLGVTYWPFVEMPENDGHGLIVKLAKDAVAVVTDDYPAFIVPGQIRALAAKTQTPVIAVDANGVVPLSLLGKIVGAAAHLRPRLHKLFPECWAARSNAEPVVKCIAKTKVDPPFKTWTVPDDITAWVKTLPLDQTVPAVPGMTGGTIAGQNMLRDFVKHKLDRYAVDRNQPDHPEKNSASGISPWLHYCHIGIEEVIDAALNTTGAWTLEEINRSTRNKDDYFCRDANVNGFLDEAITWRDVGYQWHWHKNAECTSSPNKSWQDASELPSFNFTTMDFSRAGQGTLETVLPAWAQTTLNKHATDRREFVYTLEEFEQGDTHDDLWNAAQKELVATGKIHNYLRMLWAKKVLEWSGSPEEAYRTLEHLNNKYATDGRDPNSYTGILWCFGLFDRPWPPERDVFGSVRFMSSGNTAKKFKLQGYYEYIKTLPSIANVQKGKTTAPPKTLF